MSNRIAQFAALAALAMGLAVATPAWSQAPDTRRLQDALDITDRRIQQAQELLAGSPNTQAAAEVSQAVALQGMARQAFSERRYAASSRATFDARMHADRAIALLRGLPDPNRVRDQLDRTREILDRARDRLAHCDQSAARELLRIAIDMQGRAESSYGETRYLAALQLTLSARERALRALQLCNAGESIDETVASAIQRTDDMLSRVHEQVDPSAHERARQLLANADGQQARAKSEAEASHPRIALRFTRMARDQAQRAERLTAGQARH